MPISILVVDDDDDIRESVVELLTQEGYATRQAATGTEALSVLASMPMDPCLVLLDMMMPEMTGSQVLAVLEETNKLASLPVVVISAQADESDARGARRFVRKPVSVDILLAVVREFCGPP